MFWLVAAAAGLLAQDQTPVFRTETSLAIARFHVVHKNRYVERLKAEDIILLEDGAPRPITFFEGGIDSRRTVPIELALLFDISGSVTHQGLLDMVAFKTALLDGLPNLKLSVYGFSANLLKFNGPTRNAEELSRAFHRVLNFKTGVGPPPQRIRLQLPPKRKSDRGASWIYEAVQATAIDISRAPGNATRMILVFSDGFQTTDTEAQDVAPLLKELGIPVYPVVLGHAAIAERIKQTNASRKANGELSEGARRRLDDLEDRERIILDYASLGELTGGRSFDPLMFTTDTLSQILAAMAGQVMFEFVAGFSPPPSGTPRKHKVEVRLRSKDLGKIRGGTRTIFH